MIHLFRFHSNVQEDLSRSTLCGKSFSWSRFVAGALLGASCVFLSACTKGGEGGNATADANAAGGANAGANAAGGNAEAPAKTGDAAPKSAALPDSAYKVKWVSKTIPATMKAGAKTPVKVTIKNVGDSTWPAKQKKNNVYLSYHWLPAGGGKAVVFDGLWTALPKDLGPGQEVAVTNMGVQAPDAPGKYQLQLSLVHDGVAWFEEKKAETVKAPVTVQ